MMGESLGKSGNPLPRIPGSVQVMHRTGGTGEAAVTGKETLFHRNGAPLK